MNQNNELEGNIKSTRERVLHTLLVRQYCTIIDIAKAVEINPISVRHHINKLEADDLVKSIEEKHGVGRPRRLYYLSEKGREYFPSHYLRLTLRLLDQLKEALPQSMLNNLFAQMAKEMVSKYEPSFLGLNLEERIKAATQLLNREGFSVDWEKHGSEYHIREINCPYYHISKTHPEICAVDQFLISTILNVPAEKINCLLNGDAHCIYVVSNANQNQTSA